MAREIYYGEWIMRARGWTTWAGYSPKASAMMNTNIFRLCMKPWDLILPEEGIDERLRSPEPFWRLQERYLSEKDAAIINLLPARSRIERPDKVFV